MANNKGKQMQKIYIVEGQGFGDDENAWEFCSVHMRKEGVNGAQEALQAIVDGCMLPDAGVRIREEELHS
jgi:hypothetical protein